LLAKTICSSTAVKEDVAISCLPDGHGGAGALLDTSEQTPNVVYGIGNNLNEQSTSQPVLVFGHRNL
jgi:hypothetical protein